MLNVLDLVNKKVEPNETERIANLPERFDVDTTEVRALVEIPWASMKLRDLQAQALAEIKNCGGLLGPIDVGEGKTLIAWLAAKVLNEYPAVCLIPKKLEEEFRRQIEIYKYHFNGPPDEKFILLPYSMLSAASGTDILEKINPKVIISDEAHSLRNYSSARTKRFIRYLSQHPNVKFVCMSGTLIGNSIGDVAHLSAYALKDRSPIPRTETHLDVWKACVDPDKSPTYTDIKTFRPILKGELYDQEKAQRAFNHRLKSAPGVVSSTKPMIDIPIHINMIEDVDVPKEITDTLLEIAESGMTPDGEEVIVDDEHLYRIEKNLSLGFFYKWDWDAIGGYDEEWVLCRKTWHRSLREELDANSRAHYDSPLLVSNKLAQELENDPNLVNKSYLHWAWTEWSRVKDRAKPPVIPVWISDFFFEQLKIVDGAIYWFTSTALVDKFKKIMPTYAAGDGEIPLGKRFTLAASINVHGTGKNLQCWNHNVVCEPSSSAIVWHQLIGRTHRTGQLEDAVYFDIYAHTDTFSRAIERAVEQARFKQSVEGVNQKLLAGF